MNRGRQRMLASAAVILAVTLGAGECGSSDTLSYGAGTTPTETAPQVNTSADADNASGTTTATTNSDAVTDDNATSSEPTTTPAAETRSLILLLEGEQLDGQQFDLAAVAGEDVLLWFWAPW